jgi:two-component sensor histidine kinase
MTPMVWPSRLMRLAKGSTGTPDVRPTVYSPHWERKLAPYMRPGVNPVNVSGVPLRLRPSAAQALALAIHELATEKGKAALLNVRCISISLESASVQMCGYSLEAHDGRESKEHKR